MPSMRDRWHQWHNATPIVSDGTFDDIDGTNAMLIPPRLNPWRLERSAIGAIDGEPGVAPVLFVSLALPARTSFAIDVIDNINGAMK